MAHTTTENRSFARYPVGWIAVVAFAAVLANSASVLVSAPPTPVAAVEGAMADPNFGP